MLPTVTTVRWSFQQVIPLREETFDAGTLNYETAVEQGLAGRFGYAPR